VQTLCQSNKALRGNQRITLGQVAHRQACLDAIEYLTTFGYTRAQAYSILGTAPVQGHIGGVVDIPNACATLWLPARVVTNSVMHRPDAASASYSIQRERNAAQTSRQARRATCIVMGPVADAVRRNPRKRTRALRGCTSTALVEIERPCQSRQSPE
jgi:hypothetical protein